MYAYYTANFDRVTGNANVNFEDFSPAKAVSYPVGATHMKISAGLAEIDFDTEMFAVDQAESALLPISNDIVAGLVLSPSVNANSLNEIFLVLGIEFMQEVNGGMYPLKNGAYNPLTAIKVDPSAAI